LRASDAVETTEAFTFDFLALVVFRIPPEKEIGDDKAKHRVAEELQRLVVGHAARRVFGRARFVCERVLEKSPILEAIRDAALQIVELVAQAHDLGAHVFAVALDDPPRVLRGALGHGDANLAERVDRHRENRLGIARDAEAGDAVAVEERRDDAGFDVGRRGEDNDWWHAVVADDGIRVRFRPS
jgi:hypothetical protein